ncbi:MAG: UDP-glucose 4-epimerase GalE [Exilispira sp.]
MKKDVNILVCGGAGYIGSTFCHYLRKNGYNPYIVDNLSKGHKEYVKDFDLYTYDISDYQNILNLICKLKIDVVFHFSAFIEVGESVRDPLKYYENNTAKTINLLKACIDGKVKYFIFSSTAAVYGIPDKYPITEDTKTDPINPYGRSKNMIEQILKDLDNQNLIKSISLRYFNASGAIHSLETGEAHNPETHIIPRILDVVLKRSEFFTIYGDDYPTSDGTCIRDYIHVEDLAYAHLLAMEYLVDGGKSDIFNLGSMAGYSVKQIVEAVEKVTKTKVNYKIGKRREGDPPILVASSDKIKKYLGWQTKYNLFDIIETAFLWHKKLYYNN